MWRCHGTGPHRYIGVNSSVPDRDTSVFTSSAAISEHLNPSWRAPIRAEEATRPAIPIGPRSPHIKDNSTDSLERGASSTDPREFKVSSSERAVY